MGSGAKHVRTTNTSGAQWSTGCSDDGGLLFSVPGSYYPSISLQKPMPVTFSAYHPSRLHQFQVASWHFCKDWRVWDTSERTCPDGNLGQWFSNLESISPSLCRTGARTIVKIVCLQGVECDFPPPQGSCQAMTEWDGSRKPYKLPGRTSRNWK